MPINKSLLNNKQMSTPLTPQEKLLYGIQRKPIINNIPQSINTSPVIQNASFSLLPIDNQSRSLKQPLSNLNINQLIPEEPKSSTQDDSNFLASLIGQSAAMLGAGIRGGSLSNVAENFQEMRDRRERQKEQEDLAKKYTDPNSEESKKRRLVYKSALGIDIPENYSYTDLNDPIVLQSIKDKSMEMKYAQMPKQVGISGLAKPEKEIKSNPKSMAEYREHVASLSEMGNVLDKIKLLNRTRIGAITPDISVDTQAYSASLDRAAQPMVKALAGPGTLQPEERATYGKLVPTGNTRADLALKQANDIIIEGTDKALSKMNADLSTGDISKKDYDALINQYNEQLSKKGIGIEINQIINPLTGKLEPRQKREVILKDGKKVIVDQFGYTWE